MSKHGSKGSYKQAGGTSSAPRPAPVQPKPAQAPPIVHQGKVGANKGRQGTVGYGEKK